MLRDIPGMRLRVVKIELYEMSPPLGNKGGAVSGAGPGAPAPEAQNSGRNNNDTRINRVMEN
jgi:hypothetical protein